MNNTPDLAFARWALAKALSDQPHSTPEDIVACIEALIRAVVASTPTPRDSK